jgi:hypothetical protein
MNLLLDIGSHDATSYMSLDEADAYLTSRPGFDTSDWSNLSDDQKIFALILAVKLLDSLNFRGFRAVNNQALAFPRIFPRDLLYVEDAAGRFMPFSDYQSLVDYAGLMNTAPPGIPDSVKFAQAEIVFQVIVSHLLTLEPFSTGEMDITSLGIDVISLSFGKGSASAYNLFSKDSIGAISTVKMYLREYLTNIRGALI